MQRVIFVWTISIMMASAPAIAGQHGRGGAPPPKPPQASHPQKPATVPHPAQPTTHGQSEEHAGTKSATSKPGTVQQKLQQNTNLADKLQGRLPAGTDLMTASSGFRNLGQFVAAVNVSNNLPGVSFAALKTRMVDGDMSLGQAIHDLRPQTDAQIAVTAERDAEALIRSTEQTTKPAKPVKKSKTAARKTHGRD
jgi:hypothetical protein